MKLKQPIKVVDSIMGSGKTSAAIKLMNDDFHTNFIYITPYLDEVKRIKKACPQKRFTEPKNRGKGKLSSLHDLLLKERNIATTHALFEMSTETTRELLASGNYTLILDEVVDVVEQVNICKKDIETILEKYATVKDGFLDWHDMEYPTTGGEFSKYKIMAMNKSLVMHNNSVLLWNLPVDTFKCFNEVYVLTYLFDAQPQRYYFDLYDLDYDYYIAQKDEDNEFRISEISTDFSYKEMKEFLRANINILEHDKLNAIGNGNTLSYTWYMKKENIPLINRVKKNTENYFRNIIKGKSDENMWTCFKDNKGRLKGKGYTKGFVSCNARATNEFAHKKNLAYLINKFQNPILNQFFKLRGVDLNENDYALSELVQWIWRSAIRNGEPINAYIPSVRMRDIFIEWLNDEIK